MGKGYSKSYLQKKNYLIVQQKDIYAKKHDFSFNCIL